MHKHFNAAPELPLEIYQSNNHLRLVSDRSSAATTCGLSNFCRHWNAKARTAECIRQFWKAHNHLPRVNELSKLSRVRRETASEMLSWFPPIGSAPGSAQGNCLYKVSIRPPAFGHSQQHEVDNATRHMYNSFNNVVQVTVTMPSNSDAAALFFCDNIEQLINRFVDVMCTLFRSPHFIARVERKASGNFHIHFLFIDSQSLLTNMSAHKSIRTTLKRKEQPADKEKFPDLVSLIQRVWTSLLPLQAFDNWQTWDNVQVDIKPFPVIDESWTFSYLAKDTQCFPKILSSGEKLYPEIWFRMSPELEAQVKKSPVINEFRTYTRSQAQLIINDLKSAIPANWHKVCNGSTGQQKGIRAKVTDFEALLSGLEFFAELHFDEPHFEQNDNNCSCFCLKCSDGDWRIRFEWHPLSGHIRAWIVAPRKKKTKAVITPAEACDFDKHSGRLFEAPLPKAPMAREAAKAAQSCSAESLHQSTANFRVLKLPLRVCLCAIRRRQINMASYPSCKSTQHVLGHPP